MKEVDLNPLTDIKGFIGACLVDSDSGMVLGMVGGGALNLEAAAAGNTEVVKAKRATMESLGLDDSIEDILITLGTQYHILRPLASNEAIFLYVAMNRAQANLAMARISLSTFEKKIKL
ncbi:hypothetical protein [Cerasicoccus maritimus]|uniref:hypothetical protein n=1 Tax=Cerasicoccus maritimus TaxID=490089 RepID=UPI00285293DB|nr:hypothetical protein [Cerasicoccus maritimus]